MTTFSKIILVLVLVVAGFSCDQQDEPVATKAMVTFSIDQRSMGGGRLSSPETPSFIVISLSSQSGTSVFENKKLSLLEFGQGYLTESVELSVGAYRLTKFLVLNSADNVIYATPAEGSEKGSLVSDALPINFSVTSSTPISVTPEVLKVSSTDTPALFGYASFGFAIVDNPVTVKLKVKVQLLVGEILYQDVNSRIVVKGYDSLNNVKWVQDFAYTGPNENQLAVKAGYHHYTAGINQWGIADTFTITRENLYISRADGPSPVTYVLGGSVAAKKISSYVSFTQITDGNGSTVLTPDYKVEYEYGFNGRVSKMTVLNYSVDKQSFEPLRYFLFNYDGARVAKLVGYLMPGNTLYTEDTYSYDNNGNVLSIAEKNFGAGVNSQVNFTYQLPNPMIRADYTFSDGSSFSYEFNYGNKDIVSDVTTRFGGVCSTGSYTYDKNINPLKHLGYVDFMLRDFSINNRVTENVNYIACSFPSLIPQSYSYEYDVDGYPTSYTKYYKPNSAGGQAITHVKYYYK